MERFLSMVVAVASVFWLATAQAAPPQTISYQGYLASNTGVPVTGTQSLMFSLYNVASGGTAVWSETQPSVAVNNGNFSALLGSVTPIALPFDAPYWLGVAVGADPEMAPRLSLASSPYAFRASVADSVSATAPLRVGTDNAAVCDLARAGTLRWNSAATAFEGCDGTSWKVLATAPAGSPYNLPGQTLTVTQAGSGGATFNSSPGGLSCSGGFCVGNFGSNAVVTIGVTPGAGTGFLNWTGDCSGAGSCIVTMSAPRGVQAVTGPLLTVNTDGGGTVSSSPAGISCSGPSCAAAFGLGTFVTLSQTPALGATFTGWTGAGCAGVGTCGVQMYGPTLVTASYTFPLNVTRYNNGGGTVTSAQAGINCGGGGACSSQVAVGTATTLTAVPDAGASLLGWTGCDSTSGNTCSVTINAVKNVQAKFGFPVSVLRQSAAMGTVTGTGGMNCGVTCVVSYGYGEVVGLTAVPDTGSGFGFSNWSGCDSATGSNCSVQPFSARTVTAIFSNAVAVSITPSGAGTVTSVPAGISCGATCNAVFASGASVALTASPGSGATFAGFSGCDSVAGSTCNLTLSANKSVTASFSYPLSVTVAGGTGGTVSSSPAGINCSPTCSASYANGIGVTLTATPQPGASLLSWSGGGCSGAGACVVTMTAAQNVTAQFAFPMTVSKAGAGTGTVTSSPAGINCGVTCGANFTAGQTVVLTAAAAGGSSFSSWSGCPSPSGLTCTAPMSAVRNVTATFNSP